MPAKINERTQYTDAAGKPLNNGYLYIGPQNGDPKVTQISIFSDRALTIALANPQRLDSLGQSVNKIWIPGRYSWQLEDVNNVPINSHPDAGEEPGAGTTQISNVQGTNAITGEATPTITAYIDGETYIFEAANDNTGPITLSFGGGVKALVYDGDVALFRNHIIQNQKIAAVYNETNDNFEWRNPNRKVRYGNKGADIASAATVDLSLLTGNSGTITGSTGPITSFGTTPAGSIFFLTVSSTPTITYNATSNIIQSLANVTLVSGDQLRVESLGSGNNKIEVIKADGHPLLLVGQVDMAAGAIGQSELKSTTGEVSSTGNSHQVLPGGEYGFYPQQKKTGGGTAIVQMHSNFDTMSTSYATLLNLDPVGAGTIFAQQRYIQASPPYNLGDGDIPLFIHGLIKNGPGVQIHSMWAAPDPAWYGQGPNRVDPKKVYSRGGKKFFKRKSRKSLARIMDDDFWGPEEEVEITTSFKNLDMDVLPHPFINPPPGYSVVMIDPVTKFCLRMCELLESGESVLSIFHDGLVEIGNTGLKRKSPSGVLVVAAKLK